MDELRADAHGFLRGPRSALLVFWTKKFRAAKFLWHEITIETTDGQLNRGKYPRIIEQHGDSPPQYPDPDEDEE